MWVGPCYACQRARNRWRKGLDPRRPRSLTKQSHAAELAAQKIRRERIFAEDGARLADRREAQRLYQQRIRVINGSVPREATNRKSRLPRPHSERLDPMPLLRWLDAWAAANPDDNERDLATRTGLDPKFLFDIRAGARSSVPLDFVDRLLIHAGETPDTLHSIYPIEDLHDDHTGNFGIGDFDGQSGACFTLALPEPATPLMPSGTRPLTYEPRWQSWPPEHRAVLRRIRAELAIAQPWRKHSTKWLAEQKAVAA